MTRQFNYNEFWISSDGTGAPNRNLPTQRKGKKRPSFRHPTHREDGTSWSQFQDAREQQSPLVLASLLGFRGQLRQSVNDIAVGHLSKAEVVCFSDSVTKEKR